MAVELQLRRDTTTNIASANAPLQGEVWMDTNKNQLTVGDGSTVGGWPIGIPNSPFGASGTFFWLEQHVLPTSANFAFTPTFPTIHGVSIYQALILASPCKVLTTLNGTNTSFGIGTASGASNTQLGGPINSTGGTQNQGIISPVGYYGGNLYINATSGTITGGSLTVSLLCLAMVPPTS